MYKKEKVIDFTKKTTIKKSLKIPKGNQNPYIEEEQTTQYDHGYVPLVVNTSRSFTHS
jgi:hypothetical protein